MSNPLIGPHQGRELELMLTGSKPAALFSFFSECVPFDPHLRAGRFIATMITDCYHQSIVITQPRELYRARAIDRIYKRVRRTGRMLEDDHAAVGFYLGYTDEEINTFLAHSAALDAKLLSAKPPAATAVPHESEKPV